MGITKETLQSSLKTKGVVVLDVGTATEYARCHIDGALNQSWGQDHGGFAHEVEKAFGKQRPLILYASDSISAAGYNATKFLKEQGFNAQDFPGGLREWRDAGFPVQGFQSNPVAGLK